MHTLLVVGSGIKSIAHLTEETRQVIKYSDKVLYLVNEDNLKAWIEREAKKAESLESIYFSSNKRADAYYQITTYIVNQYYKVKTLCVIFYGHPTIFAQSALNAVKIIRAENGNAVVLPAVSSMDCLFSDLEIDPGEQGCFAIDVTELLIYERKLDVYANNILWQISNLGMHDTKQTKKLKVLCHYLRNYYQEDQPICIYEAAVLPLQKPRIEWLTLQQLMHAQINPISTLYIPPITQRYMSKKYLDLLGMSVQDFKLSAETNTASE